MKRFRELVFSVPGWLLVGMFALWLVPFLLHDLDGHPVALYWRSFQVYADLFLLSLVGMLTLNLLQIVSKFWSRPGVWLKVIGLCGGYWLILILFFSIQSVAFRSFEYFGCDVEGSFLMTAMPVAFGYILLGLGIGVLYTIDRVIGFILRKCLTRGEQEQSRAYCLTDLLRQHPISARSWRRFFGVLAVIVLIGGGMAFWWMNLNPVVIVPTPVMPSPNGYDSYLKAANELDMLIPFVLEPGNYSDEFPPLKPEKGERLLASRGQVKAAMLPATRCASRTPPVHTLEHIDAGPSDTMHKPLRDKFSKLASYLAFLAAEERKERHWAAAMEDSLSAVRLGADLQFGSNLDGAITGMMCAMKGRREAWRTVGQLNATEARRFLAVMQEINAREVPFTRVMQEEQWSDQATFSALFREPGWRGKLAEYIDEGSYHISYDSYEHPYYGFRFLLVHKRHSLHALSSYLDQCIAITSRPFSQRPQTDPPVPNDALCSYIAPACLNGWLLSLKNQTGNRQLTVTLALRAYHAAHGCYPATLQDLVSAGYIESLPPDPFANAETFRYRRKGKTYLLYSIGPDCTDNGGAPITDDGSRYNPGHALILDSTGDIVAGRDEI